MESGVMSDEAQNEPYSYALEQSPRGGKMDYWASYLAKEMYVNGITEKDIGNDKGAFYIIQGVNKAYNPMDAGNFYWGGAMNVLGINQEIAKVAANIHNALDQKSPGFFDSGYDQKAIEEGYNKLNKFP